MQPSEGAPVSRGMMEKLERQAAAHRIESARVEALSRLEAEGAALRLALEALVRASEPIQDESPGSGPAQAALVAARAAAREVLAAAEIAGKSLIAKIVASDAATRARVRALRVGPRDFLCVSGPEGMTSDVMHHLLRLISGAAPQGTAIVLCEPGFTVELASKAQLESILAGLA